MVVVIVTVELLNSLYFLPYRCSVCCDIRVVPQLPPSKHWAHQQTRLGTGSVDGPSVLMEGVRGQHEHHNKQSNDKEANRDWFAILPLQLLQPYAATCDKTQQ